MALITVLVDSLHRQNSHVICNGRTHLHPIHRTVERVNEKFNALQRRDTAGLITSGERRINFLHAQHARKLSVWDAIMLEKMHFKNLFAKILVFPLKPPRHTTDSFNRRFKAFGLFFFATLHTNI